MYWHFLHHQLEQFLLYFFYLYCPNYIEHKFDESIIPESENNKSLEKEKLELLKRLEANEKTIEQCKKDGIVLL